MWNEIRDEQTLEAFLQSVRFFHDSCISEMYYRSGAYVNSDYSMHPVNDNRTLRVTFQSQFSQVGIFEVEFEKLNYLHLNPANEAYTCELLDATMLLTGQGICWCDCGGLCAADLTDYGGTAISAKHARWQFLGRENTGNAEESSIRPEFQK